MSVRLVLDASAILVYAGGSEAVGEIVAMITEDGDEVGVPAAALAEAYSRAKGSDGDMVRLLVSGLPAVTVLPLNHENAAEVGAVARQASIGTAHAVTVTASLGAYIATADGQTIRRILTDDWPVIDLS